MNYIGPPSPPPPPPPVPGCQECARLVAKERADKANGDESGAVDARVLRRQHGLQHTTCT
ncbi:hypothetical protein [Kitasatospora kifunensis]|uniref:Uncharacterized protein n=1 Tax=Kitasatospora kifunensis TaxID=58351 RepID=A0A7W7VYC6_KITKI|nr:hypothetical protein [Kitasatospora kifunensis]MBB4926520.1 hypothetical protein [Kitasatospora kifunensis]